MFILPNLKRNNKAYSTKHIIVQFLRARQVLRALSIRSCSDMEISEVVIFFFLCNLFPSPPLMPFPRIQIDGQCRRFDRAQQIDDVVHEQSEDNLNISEYRNRRNFYHNQLEYDAIDYEV